MNYEEVLKKMEKVYNEKSKKSLIERGTVSLDYLHQEIPELSESFWSWFDKELGVSINKYKYTLTTLPNWSGDFNYYYIGKDRFSHLIIEFY